MSGVKDVSSISVDTSLGDLGLDSLMGVEIKQTLERDHDLVLSTTEIRQLTITKLQELSLGGGQREEPPPSGASPYRYQLDKMMPDRPITCLQVKQDKTLFVVHPLEGMSARFLNSLGLDKTYMNNENVLFEKMPKCSFHDLGDCISLKDLVEKLPYTVYGLQCSEDVPIDSISSMASYYIQVY